MPLPARCSDGADHPRAAVPGLWRPVTAEPTIPGLVLSLGEAGPTMGGAGPASAMLAHFDSSSVATGAHLGARRRTPAESRVRASHCPAYACGRRRTPADGARNCLVMSRSAVRVRSSAPSFPVPGSHRAGGHEGLWLSTPSARLTPAFGRRSRSARVAVELELVRSARPDGVGRDSADVFTHVPINYGVCLPTRARPRARWRARAGGSGSPGPSTRGPEARPRRTRMRGTRRSGRRNRRCCPDSRP